MLLDSGWSDDTQISVLRSCALPISLNVLTLGSVSGHVLIRAEIISLRRLIGLSYTQQLCMNPIPGTKRK